MISAWPRTSTWLLSLFVCRGPVLAAAGRRGRRIHSAQLQGASALAPASSNGDDGGGEPFGNPRSFYERNGLTPPAPPSRASAALRISNKLASALSIPKRFVMRRAQQTNSAEDGTNSEGNATNSTNSLAFALATESAEDTATNLDLLAGADPDDDAATPLREDLVAGYDKHAPPPRLPGSASGAPVELGLNFHRVFEVDMLSSILDLIVWIRLEWADPRLAWRPEEYGNLTEVRFWIGDGGTGGETTEIWAPDIELWNLEEGIRSSFTDAYAIVSHDGSIFWSRPGHLRPVCKFHGLDAFPFDQLTCTMEFGSWSYSGKHLRLVKGGGGVGYSVGGSETAGELYNEFSLAKENPIKCKVHVYPPYPAAPLDDWPVLIYNVTIERAWQPYARGYITLQVLLNVVGFSVFWLPPSCGERMGLSITAVLAAVASDFVVAEKLPAFGEFTWIQKFSMFSMIFAFLSLLECVMVLYFYYKRDAGVIPWWLTQLRKRLCRHAKASVDETSDTSHNRTDSLPDGKRYSRADDQKNQDGASFSENSIEGKMNYKAEPDTNPADFSSMDIEQVSHPGESASKRRQSLMRQGAKSSRHESEFTWAPKDADDFVDQDELDLNKRWKEVADRLDDVSRFLIPMVYFITLSVVLGQDKRISVGV